MGGCVNPLRLASLAASPFCFAKRGGHLSLPLDVQGGTKGGLDLSLRFGTTCRTPLDSDFRRNDDNVGITKDHHARTLIPQTHHSQLVRAI